MLKKENIWEYILDHVHVCHQKDSRHYFRHRFIYEHMILDNKVKLLPIFDNFKNTHKFRKKIQYLPDLDTFQRIIANRQKLTKEYLAMTDGSHVIFSHYYNFELSRRQDKLKSLGILERANGSRTLYFVFLLTYFKIIISWL